MLNRVGDQLVEDCRQGLSLIGLNGTETAGRDDLDGVVRGGDRTGHAHDRACDLVEVNRLIDVLRQGGVHGRDRLHAALGLSERDLDGFLGGAARLKAQQGGYGLQVVLDAVVDLADRRVLRHEFLLVTVNLGDVARQDDGAQALTSVDEGQGTHADGGCARGDLDAPGGTAHDNDRHGFLDEGAIPDDLGNLLSENLSGHVRADAEAAQARHSVGGRVLDAALRIQQDGAVEDSRDAMGGDLRC